MYATTAAHPTLPLGSIVRVVNMRNHRSQIVRINDRGPYVEGRELDVSYEVARRLGFDGKGLAKVRVELLEVPSRPNSESPQLIVALDVDNAAAACFLGTPPARLGSDPESWQPAFHRRRPEHS